MKSTLWILNAIITLALFSTTLTAEEVVIVEEVPDVIVEPVIIEDDEPDFPVDGSFEEMREYLGITDQPTERSDVELYGFRDLGEFAISKESFVNPGQALDFCASLKSSNGADPFQLITPGMGLGFAFMGLPFENIHNTSIVKVPVLKSEGLRTGVVFWTLNEDGSKNLEEVYAFTDGNGAGAGGPQNLKALNQRLEAAGEGPVKMPAICVDKNLKDYFDAM